MRRGLLIDVYGHVWPVPRPDLTSARWSGTLPSEAAWSPGIFYIGPVWNGIEVAVCGERVSARALSKALHILASRRPQRVVLTQCNGGSTQIRIFPGVWEFGEHAEALGAASAPKGGSSDGVALVPSLSTL
jgi:hypothetical protein